VPSSSAMCRTASSQASRRLPQRQPQP
jgi:hypothetical protein